MHKRVLIVLLCLLVLSIAQAQDTPTVSPELQEQLDEIERITSGIRGLERLEETTLGFPTRDDLQDYVMSQFELQYDPEEFADDVLFYVGLDLMSADIDLPSILVDFLSTQIAGYYDAETKTMNVILSTGEIPTDSIPIGEALIYAHEYVHALQDQHFGLQSITDLIEESDNPDMQLAVLSLIEGDATNLMANYVFTLSEQQRLDLIQSLSESGDLGAIALPDDVPPIIEDELLFPYIRGQLFVSEIVSDMGWVAIDDAFANNLPQSTEHIYHPERYLAGDVPLDVSIPDMRDVLGEGWRLVHDTPVGEFYLRQYLGTQLGSSLIREMATGWGGDRMKLWVDDDTGELVWVLYQVWDTAQDATEFAEGYLQFLDARFADGDSDGTCWTGDDTTCFAQIDEVTTRISYSFDPALARDLLMLQ